jgi:hypothetical protein
MRVTEQSSFRRPEAQRLADQTPATATAGGRRLPAAPRERKPALAALAVLLIVGGALITTFLVLQSGDRISAIAIRERVGAGQRIPEAALKEVQIADGSVPYVPWEAREQVAQHYAAVDLVPDTLLNEGMVTLSSTELVPGKAVVGLSLKAGQVPVGLTPGQRVQVIHVPGDDGAIGGGKVLAPRALVHHVGADGSETGGNTIVTIVVDDDASPVITAYASAGRIALAYLPGVGAEGARDQGGGTEPAPAPTAGQGQGGRQDQVQDQGQGAPTATPAANREPRTDPSPTRQAQSAQPVQPRPTAEQTRRQTQEPGPDETTQIEGG